MLTAGLDGIMNKEPLPEAVEEDVYCFDNRMLKERGIETLLGSLFEALEELEKDKVVLESLGKHSGKMYLDAKRKEWDSYRTSVSEWELRQYLSTV